MTKARIAINTLSVTSAHEGIRTLLTRLVPALVRVGEHHQYRLICSTTNEDLFREVGDGVDRVVLTLRGQGPLHRIWHDQVTVPRLVRNETDLLFTPSSVGSVATRTPQVVTVPAHLALPSLRRQLPETAFSAAHRLYYGPVMRLSHRRATSVVAISEYLRGQLVAETGLAPEKSEAILIGVDPLPLRPPGADGAYALFVGTLYPYKNVALAVDALGLARPELPDGFRLLVAGADPDGRQTAALTARATAAGVGDRVALLGRVDDQELEGLYEAATLLVLPSRAEGFGIPALEAMARGVPVIVSDRTALPEVVAGAGLVVDPDDPAGLAARLVEIAGDPALQARLALTGRQRADQLSWDMIAHAYVELFDRVLKLVSA